MPDKRERYLYVKHLVAHAHDKIRDSARATGVLRLMYHELAGGDNASLRRLPFTAEMALIAAAVRAYPPGLQHPSHAHPHWIRNDTNTYDYLDHYYLTQSRLDVYWRKPVHSYYVDSLQIVFERSANNPDRAYYSLALASLYRASKSYRQSNDYYVINSELNARLSRK